MHHYATFLSLEFPQSYLLECVGIEPARIEHVKPGAKRSDGPVKVLTWLTKSSTVLIEEAHGNLQMEAVEFHSVHKTEQRSRGESASTQCNKSFSVAPSAASF